jgi:hypothetical protein
MTYRAVYTRFVETDAELQLPRDILLVLGTFMAWEVPLTRAERDDLWTRKQLDGRMSEGLYYGADNDPATFLVQLHGASSAWTKRIYLYAAGQFFQAAFENEDTRYARGYGAP